MSPPVWLLMLLGACARCCAQDLLLETILSAPLLETSSTGTEPPTSITVPPESTTPLSSPESTTPLSSPDEQCNCGPNSNCEWDPSSKRFQCSCLDGYDGPPPNCQPGSKLWEVCYKGNRCGPYSECEMDKEGERYCRCKEGYFGCPPLCQPGPRILAQCSKCGPNTECIFVKGRAECRCVPGYEGEPPDNCTAGAELLESCNPYPCGAFTGCFMSSGLPWCYCLPGFVGAAPYCAPGPEMWEVCFKDKPCGQHSFCTVEDRAAKCSPCLKGYSGTPPNCVKETKDEKQEEPIKKTENGPHKKP